MSDDDPTEEEILAAFADLPVIGPYAISKEDNMGGNVCCAKCLARWLKEGTDWRSTPIHVVVLHEGTSLCVEHYREVLDIPLLVEEGRG